MKYKNIYKNKIAVLGLGYVGLPLIIELSKKFKVTGFDIDKVKINNLKLKKNIFEIEKKNFKFLRKIHFTYNIKEIKNCEIFIITVPTPIYKNNLPDLRILKNATRYVSSILKPKDLVIFESTVFPGATEEICIPILEKYSNCKLYKESYLRKNYFWCGYSPERINPSDKLHTLSKTNKIVSGSDDNVANFLKKFYKTIIKSRVIAVKSIKVAEASKILENTQRDLNIALMNELSPVYSKLGIKTTDVIKAAGTKWNFEKFYPGLVGGHCISVDPYYMAYKARKLNAHCRLIQNARKINDYIPNYVCKKFISKINVDKKDMIKKILILGITFKENCPDVRNSKVVNIYKIIKKKNFKVDIYDPVADEKEVKKLYNIKLITNLKYNYYDGLIIAVRHQIFIKKGIHELRKLTKKESIIFDLKTIFPDENLDFNL